MRRLVPAWTLCVMTREFSWRAHPDDTSRGARRRPRVAL